MKKPRRWLLVPLVVVPAYVALRWLGGDSAQDEPPAAVFDRVWMENIPEEPTDYLHGFYVLDAQPAGVFHRSSAFDFHIELFQYSRKGNTFDLRFPQTDKKAKVTFAVKTCDDLPPFDMCLTLSSNPWGGPTKYYGFGDADAEAKALPGARETLVGHAAAAARR